MKTKEIIKRARELAKPSRIGGDRSSRLTRSGLSKSGRRKTQGTRRSEKEVVEQVASGAAQDGFAVRAGGICFEFGRDHLDPWANGIESALSGN